MKALASVILMVIAGVTMGAEPVQPDIRDGVWHIPFRYWSHLSPVLDGAGGFDFLCEVEELGKDVPEPKEPPARFKPGALRVLEVLHANTDVFPRVRAVKTLQVEGCEGLEVGDRLIVFVNAEDYEGGYVIDRHRGTNCLIGHRLARKDDEGADRHQENRLIELVRSGKLDVSGASADRLRLLALMDPDGVMRALIRQIEMGRLAWRPGL